MNSNDTTGGGRGSDNMNICFWCVCVATPVKPPKKTLEKKLTKIIVLGTQIFGCCISAQKYTLTVGTFTI